MCRPNCLCRTEKAVDGQRTGGTIHRPVHDLRHLEMKVGILIVVQHTDQVALSVEVAAAVANAIPIEVACVMEAEMDIVIEVGAESGTI